MSAVIGIDLGTTNSVLAHIDGRRPVAVPIDGGAIVPSTVLFLDDRIVVGREARNLQLQHPERTVRSAKRKIGTDHRYSVGGREVTPEQVSAEILRTLKTGAERALGVPVQQAVITVPAYFDDAQRRATLRAGELAGLDVLRLLNEPTSASMVYDQVGNTARGDTPELVLIYDLGGGTFDVSVLEVFGDVREVRATTGNTHLGGDDFDEKLVHRFLEELKRREHIDPRDDLRAMARLERLAEKTKIDLSSALEVHVREEFLTTRAGKPVHLDVTITRRDFESEIEAMLQSTIELSDRAVKDAGITAADLSRVCLVGGSTRIPRVRQLLRDQFGLDIHDEIDPDLAVGLGAALQAALLTGVEVDRILVDVASHSLGIRVIGDDDMDSDDDPDTFAPILARNTVLPATRTEEFYTVVDKQDALKVEVFQGEMPRVSRNVLVGDFMHPLVPAPAHSPIRVTFEYDLNGVVKVSVEQPGKGPAKTVELSVADVGTTIPTSTAPLPASAVERRAQALLASCDGEERTLLEGLLEAYRTARPHDRLDAEEALLDFFLDHEDDGGDDVRIEE